MPRDGSNVYFAPPGSSAVTETLIESAKYNALVQDLVQDLNTPRPVSSGGTGAGTPAEGRVNLSLGTIATRNITVSTAAPSGGADGDLWFQVEP